MSKNHYTGSKYFGLFNIFTLLIADGMYSIPMAHHIHKLFSLNTSYRYDFVTFTRSDVDALCSCS